MTKKVWKNDGTWQGSDGFWWRVNVGDESNYASVVVMTDSWAADLPNHAFIVESGTLCLDDKAYTESIGTKEPSDDLRERFYTINAVFGFDYDELAGEKIYSIGEVNLTDLSENLRDSWERVADNVIILPLGTIREEFIREEFLSNT